MAYIDDEQSTSNAKPIELYRFTGTYQNYYYTSGVEKVTYQAPGETAPHDYLPIAIKRSEISVGTHEDDTTDITVTLKASNQVVLDYGFETSPPELNLTIFRFHNIADVKQVWFGEVTNIQVNDGIATVRSPSLLSSIMTAQAPTVYYQSPCNNVLFDARCKVDEPTYTHAATVTAVAGRSITVDGVGTLGGKLKGGEIVLASGERRMIVSQVGTVIGVNFPFAQLIPGATCAIKAGCDHLWAGDCKLVYNNRLNFGGFVFIPPDNPFAGGIQPSASGIADHTCLPAAFAGWWLKVRIDFWQASIGPSSFPNFIMDMDSDLDGVVNPGSGIAAGYGATPSPAYWQDQSGAHTVQSLELTFNNGHFPTDFTGTARKWNLELQFPSLSIPSGGPALGVLSIKRWFESGFTNVNPTGGTGQPAPYFDLTQLFPRDYQFIF